MQASPSLICVSSFLSLSQFCVGEWKTGHEATVSALQYMNTITGMEIYQLISFCYQSQEGDGWGDGGDDWNDF